jgi:hypothetical protein
MTNHTPTILLLAGAALFAGATIPTVHWLQCTAHAGGLACSGAASTARESWLAVASTLLGIAYQAQRGHR